MTYSLIKEESKLLLHVSLPSINYNGLISDSKKDLQYCYNPSV